MKYISTRQRRLLFAFAAAVLARQCRYDHDSLRAFDDKTEYDTGA